MATKYKGTVLDVLQIIADKRGESSVNTNASRIRAVSRAEQDISTRKFWRLYLLTDQTATGDGSTASFSIGSSTYPSRIKGLSELFVGGTTEGYRYSIIDYTAFKNQASLNSNAHVAYEWFDVANDVWKVKINPTPSNGEAIYYTYFWTPPTRTTTSDVVVTLDFMACAYLALSYIYEGEEEPQLSIDAINKAERIIGDLEGIEEAPAVGQIYQMGSQVNSQRPQGIGSY